MRWSGVSASTLALALALALLVGPVAGQTEAANGGPDAGLTITVELDVDGDAEWTVAAAYPLDSADERRAFERLREEFVRGDDVGFDADTFRSLAADAGERTGRQMGVVNVSRDGQVVNGTDNEVGVLTLSFTWQAFADVRGDQIVVGDVFGTEWELGPDERLVIHPPPNHGVIDSSPESAVDEGVLRWTGTQSFDANEPAVTYLRGASGPGSGGPAASLALAALAAVVVGVVVYSVARRDPRSILGIGSGGSEDAVADGAPELTATESAGADGPGDGSAVEQLRPEPGADADDRAGGSDAASASAPVAEPELLSDEERVEQLLHRRDGRMKQADIVAETGWSNAKVSQLLSAMDEEGRIDKLRIGRENLITLAGVDPADPPDDEE